MTADTLQLFLTLLVPLVIIMDPLGNLPIYLMLTNRNTVAERRRIAALAAFAAGAILAFFALTGDAILEFFAISLPAFQIAGGVIFFIYALQMLALIPSGIKTSGEEEEEGMKKASIALVPLATPLLAGPGAITAVLVWHQRLEAPGASLALLAAIAVACLLVYVALYFAEFLRRVLGVGGIRVVSRLMGLLLAVIAVEFVVSGYQQLVPP